MVIHMVKFHATSDHHANATSVLSNATVIDPPTTPVQITIIIIALASLGVASNAFTLVVICLAPNFTRAKSGLFITQQTIIDLLSSLLFIVTQVVLLVDIDIVGIRGEAYCRLVKSHSLLWVCLKASTLNLLNISFERYLLVVRPIYHRQHFTRIKTYVLLSFAWLGSLFLNLPLFVASKIKDGACNFKESPLGDIDVQLVYGFVEFIAVYLIPLIMMTFFYGRMLDVISRKLIRTNTPKRSHCVQPSTSSGHSLNHAQVNLVKTFLVVSLLYIICWTPTQLYCLLFGLRTQISLPFKRPFQDPGYAAAMSMAVLNLCINPLVYAYKYTAFRTQVVRIFSPRCVTTTECV